jgi:hypothetical protein
MTTVCVILSIAFTIGGQTITQTYDTNIKMTQVLIDEINKQGGKVVDIDIRQIECKKGKK